LSVGTGEYIDTEIRLSALRMAVNA